ncbi:hypothetical protein GUITHDRAFT_146624 [Guillardia theta CCMP2712]|uniref:Galactokinase n=1 Tax=Guillardia theta (strain CCMP2712) TaxID=905079 RepID=L1IH15_GUITC|nr:hypothetical protein GUITHDRAFT_146624 [Guillardia theta CCMP2712]EKX35214.1 hypothetical protein GUITHDRAFT_146624 [Guillardia theta CCMP2712]|eukprot:XP_005822194.1 hypothetical protein GUITHDRAFT_146624 [Guillardia theta CCMP2712]
MDGLCANTIAPLAPLRLKGGGRSYENAGPVVKSVVEKFRSVHGEDPKYVSVAPGRVNLIGEHTDYSQGFVMPCAIDFHVAASFCPTSDNKLHVIALDVNDETCSIDLSKPIERDQSQPWSNYIRGVCKTLMDNGHKIGGGKFVFSGNVPLGGGLSSSAALEVCFAKALNHAYNLKIGGVEIAQLSQAAEHWVGCKCGIMDQYISSMGVEGKALMIDCRDLSAKNVEIPKGVAVVIVNSNAKHELAGLDSEYNARREQCEQAARHFGVSYLREVTPEQLERDSKELDPVVLKRARHVVLENDRVSKTVEALKQGDLKTVGKLMLASHMSLKNDFEVSTPEIDALVDIIGAVVGEEGGVRITGGGFGGSVVCLTPESKVEEIRKAVEENYPKRAGGRQATFYVCHASAGAHILE